MSKKEVFNILQVGYPHLPNPAGGKSIIYIVAAIIILGFILEGISLATTSHSASSQGPAPTPQPTPEVNGSTPTPSQTQIGQETTQSTQAYYTQLRKYENTRSVLNANPALMIPMKNIASMQEIPVYGSVQFGGQSNYYITSTEITSDSMTMSVENRGKEIGASPIVVALFTNDYRSATFSASIIENKDAKNFKVELSNRNIAPQYFKNFADMLGKTQYIIFAQNY